MGQTNPQIRSCVLCGKQIAVINCKDCGDQYCASCAPLQRNVGSSFGQCNDCDWKMIEERR